MQRGKRKVVTVGNYRFTGKLLGKGNFARVEEAVHNVLNVKVAVKIMDISQIQEEYVIKNLRREAKIMSKLNHPCIAALFQTMQRSDNVYYLVTELVSGGDLCSFIKGQRNGKLEERPTRIYARQFASALSHMHSLGVVHRDLKMENVMLNSIQTQIKIVDFGLSNVWSADNPLRTHCGSPEYAAPELFVTGKEYGAEVDLWSLGIILYGMVVGQLPFVSNRNDHVSSQERRKRLVSQINKGLATQHRRAIACFSTDFRNMMNKLLIADATQRITIKELIIHPWITDNGKKMIRTNPIRPIQANWHAKIISEIGTMMHVNVGVVLQIIGDEPYGKVAGIFNILVHKHTTNLLNGDGVTRTTVPITIEPDQAPSRTHPQRKDSAVYAISHEKVRQHPCIEPPGTAPVGTRNAYTPRVLLRNKQFNPEPVVEEEKKLVSSESKHHHFRTIICDQSVDYRMITSPTLRRKAYSATISAKLVQQTSMDKGKVVVEVPIETNVKTSSTRNGFSASGRRKICVVEDMPKRYPVLKSPVFTSSFRPKTSVSNSKNQGKPEGPSGTKRAVTSHAADRIPKRYSISSVKVVQGAVPKVESDHHGNDKKILHKESCRANSLRYACGDGSGRPSTTPSDPMKNFKKSFMYDPIARSIAGYVANNMPDKMSAFSWLKK